LSINLLKHVFSNKVWQCLLAYSFKASAHRYYYKILYQTHQRSSLKFAAEVLNVFGYSDKFSRW